MTASSLYIDSSHLFITAGLLPKEVAKDAVEKAHESGIPLISYLVKNNLLSSKLILNHFATRLIYLFLILINMMQHGLMLMLSLMNYYSN